MNLIKSGSRKEVRFNRVRNREIHSVKLQKNVRRPLLLKNKRGNTLEKFSKLPLGEDERYKH